MSCPTHIIGFDDTPFPKQHRGDVTIVGAVFTGPRLDGVLCGRVRRDGANATARIIELVCASRFHAHLQLVMLQGIALGGFNVVDIHRLHTELSLPVLVVCRKQPNFTAIRSALLGKVRSGQSKWRLIEQAGEMERVAEVYIQRAGIDLPTAAAAVTRTAIHSVIPEPLRTAHIIAAGITPLQSRHRV